MMVVASLRMVVVVSPRMMALVSPRPMALASLRMVVVVLSLHSLSLPEKPHSSVAVKAHLQAVNGSL